MSQIYVNTINEYATNNGVTIDGVLVKDSAIAKSYISGELQGLTNAQQFRLTANITTTGTNLISTNLSAPSNLSFGSKGSLVSESSGIFSFSETGFYMVNVSAMVGGGKQTHIITQLTTDDTNYTDVAGAGTLSDTEGVRGGSSSCILDITDTTNMKVKFSSYIQSSSGTIYGSTTANNSVFTFLKLGDT